MFAAKAGKSFGRQLGLAEVDAVIAVASGKGGVGKSTTAVNLAVAMATALSMRVGLLDADIHGPSIPTMMNLSGKPGVSDAPQPLMRPLENYGVRCMSMGFFLEKPDDPIIWRGPIVNTALDKLLVGTDWGNLDALVVDMPPGTGDAQITLGQRLPLAGAVIVSTPQDIALLDARRGARMFQQVEVPLLGIVENMSGYQCRKCGHVEHVFGEGGAAHTAQELGIDLLGKVPLDIQIRMQSDVGAPVVISDPSGPSARAFISIAERIRDKLARSGAARRQGPNIVEE